MRRILIADTSPVLCEALANCLKTQYDVNFCFDGQEVIAYINKLTPDLLVLDLELPNVDGIAVLDMLRCAGNNMPVVVLTANAGECVMQILNALKVSYVCPKPCSLETLVCGIRMVANIEDSALWIPETEVDNLLLHLGFRMGLTRYDNVRAAILMKHNDAVDGMTKSLYPAIAAQNSGTATQVEKSIRDAIHQAFRTGDRNNWCLYFPGALGGKCPSNEMFIARMVSALKNRERVQKVKTQYLKAENE